MPENVQKDYCIFYWVLVFLLAEDIDDQGNVVCRFDKVSNNLYDLINLLLWVRNVFSIMWNFDQWLQNSFSMLGDTVLPNQQCEFELVQSLWFGLVAVRELGDFVNALNNVKYTNLTSWSRLRAIRYLMGSEGLSTSLQDYLGSTRGISKKAWFKLI